MKELNFKDAQMAIEPEPSGVDVERLSLDDCRVDYVMSVTDEWTVIYNAEDDMLSLMNDLSCYSDEWREEWLDGGIY